MDLGLSARTTTLDRWEQSTLERWRVLDTMDAMVVAVRCTGRAMCVTARRSDASHHDAVAAAVRADETPECEPARRTLCPPGRFSSPA